MYGTNAYFAATVAFDLVPMRVAPPAFFAALSYWAIGLHAGCATCVLAFLGMSPSWRLVPHACCRRPSVLPSHGPAEYPPFWVGRMPVVPVFSPYASLCMAQPCSHSVQQLWLRCISSASTLQQGCEQQKRSRAALTFMLPAMHAMSSTVQYCMLPVHPMHDAYLRKFDWTRAMTENLDLPVSLCRAGILVWANITAATMAMVIDAAHESTELHVHVGLLLRSHPGVGQHRGGDNGDDDRGGDSLRCRRQHRRQSRHHGVAALRRLHAEQGPGAWFSLQPALNFL